MPASDFMEDTKNYDSISILWILRVTLQWWRFRYGNYDG